MKIRRGCPWLAFPILGSLLALSFRATETDWQTFSASRNLQPAEVFLYLPDGQTLRLLEVPHADATPSIYLGAQEITREQFRAYDPGFQGLPGSAAVSLEQARAYCDWLSAHTGRHVRLPTLDEWRLAARAGHKTAPYPWGFSEDRRPSGLHFALKAKPATPGPALGYGFRDLAGGLWEWTAEGSVIGSAWSETNAQTLHLDTTLSLPADYRDEDTGFRILLED